MKRVTILLCFISSIIGASIATKLGAMWYIKKADEYFYDGMKDLENIVKSAYRTKEKNTR